MNDYNDDGYGEKAEQQYEQALAPEKPSDTSSWPFQCLGFDRDRFFIYTAEGRQVLPYSARALHSSADLVALAPVRFFEDNFPGKMGFDIRRAGNEIIRACYRAGIYNPDAQRGRGVWLDEGRRVMHLGERLIVDGASVPLADHLSEFIYERARPMNVALGLPLADDEGRALLNMCCSVAWGSPDRDGRLFLGWIVSALIGGALSWRPHLLITAGGGGGKTWILENIVQPLLGPLALLVEGKTTQAGILGEIGRDARPIIFDEGETQNEADRERMQSVLDLARLSSSEGGAIVKGTKEGGSRRYIMRASFVFASINNPLTQAADESRFAAIGLVDGSADQFRDLRQAHSDVMQPGISGRLLARALNMIPTIRHNAEMLADAISRTGAGRRVGDTLGTLVACAMSVITTDQLTSTAADSFVAARDWLRDFALEAKVIPEHERAMVKLLQAPALRLVEGKGSQALSVAELVSICYRNSLDPDPPPVSEKAADIALRRLGIRVDGDQLRLHYRSDFIEEAFRNTPWATGWPTTIARFPSARKNVNVRYIDGITGKSLSLSIPEIFGEENG